MIIVRKTINWLFLISFLFLSCKKKLNSDFDPIIGKWKWVKTVHSWNDSHGIPYVETVATSMTLADSYTIEFEKKGKIITYNNNKVKDKYRIKDYQSTFLPVENSWGYEMTLNGKKIIQITYNISKDTLLIDDFFPKTKSDYNIAEGSQSYINNYFIRE